MSDIWRIEISSLTLKHPVIHYDEEKELCARTFVRTTIFIQPDRVSHVINDGKEVVRAVDNPAFHPEDQRRIDWLISTARSMM